MRPDLTWPLIVRFALLLSFTMGPSLAAAQGRPAPGRHQAFLYELSEHAVLLNDAGHVLVPDPTGQSPTRFVDPATGGVGIPARRRATSELQGLASLGTPLCADAVFVTNSRPDTCTIAAMGASDVSLATGEGTLSGTYAVLVQLDNALDSPELPLQTGAFHGSITFRPPLGFATAFLVVNGTVQDAQACAESPRTDCIRFTATFRQPVAMSARGRHVKPRRGQRAFYLVDDERVSVQPDERAVGWPTVRFEINF